MEVYYQGTDITDSVQVKSFGTMAVDEATAWQSNLITLPAGIAGEQKKITRLRSRIMATIVESCM